MKIKNWIPFAAALILGLFAAKMARDLASRGHAVASTNEKLLQVVAASHDLGPGQALQPEDLTTTKVSVQGAPEHTFHEVSELVGRVTAGEILKGQTILEPQLAQAGAGAGLQAFIPDGMRAITIDVNEVTGLAGMLVPGCHVDVVSNINNPDTDKAVTRTVVANVLVTAVGQRLTKSRPDANKDHEQVSRTVTMVATPRQAELIDMATAMTRMRLVLRGATDSGSGDLGGVSFVELRGRPPVPTEIIPVDSGGDKGGKGHRFRSASVIRGATETKVEFDMSPPSGAHAEQAAEASQAPILPR